MKTKSSQRDKAEENTWEKSKIAVFSKVLITELPRLPSWNRISSLTTKEFEISQNNSSNKYNRCEVASASLIRIIINNSNINHKYLNLKIDPSFKSLN